MVGQSKEVERKAHGRSCMSRSPTYPTCTLRWELLYCEWTIWYRSIFTEVGETSEYCASAFEYHQTLVQSKMKTPPVAAFDKEALVKRNPHENFSEVEASRPDYDSSKTWIASKIPNPSWKPGDGALRDGWQKSQLIAIDP
jgi:hypothetical protein